MNESLFDSAIAKIDAVNRADPNHEIHAGKSWPKEFLYSTRMAEMLVRYAPDADDAVKLAARAQHIQRWHLPRSDYPINRKGYHQWRAALNTFHADTVADLLGELGLSDEVIVRVQRVVGKRSLKTESDSQLLEDVAGLVFLEHYLADFAASHPEYDDKKWCVIFSRIWNKLSSKARQFIQEGRVMLPESMHSRFFKCCDE